MLLGVTTRWIDGTSGVSGTVGDDTGVGKLNSRSIVLVRQMHARNRGALALRPGRRVFFRGRICVHWGASRAFLAFSFVFLSFSCLLLLSYRGAVAHCRVAALAAGLRSFCFFVSLVLGAR
ncbi:hypothetical protein C8R47DRAFT_730507 [Mycena vitilis]|nr:hypothetical protein C8R47DRAFT_730507 [Mycena vitilis]